MGRSHHGLPLLLDNQLFANGRQRWTTIRDSSRRWFRVITEGDRCR